MPHEHVETHFRSTNVVRDVVIGMADGLTVPFALAAGLSGAVQNTRLIVVGGLAEIAAGSIAMAWADIWRPAAMPNTTSRNGRASIARSRKFPRKRWQKWDAFSSPTA
jgi:hypothetical protein